MNPDLSRRGFLLASGTLAAGALLDPSIVRALDETDDAYDLWLRYPRTADPGLLAAYRSVLTHVVSPGVDGPLRSAVDELTRGLAGLLDRTVPEKPRPDGPGAVIVGTPESSPIIAREIDAAELARLGSDGYLLRRTRDAVLIASSGANGALYGAFHLLRLVRTHRPIRSLRESPANALRLANHWDNLDRSVERGYAGPSIFHWDTLPEILPRYVDYARALASVGLNGTVVNNVNANSTFLSTPMIGALAPLADVFRDWGLKLYLSANFASPILLDGLPTADPFDDEVKQWWQDKADEIYAAIPHFGGFLVKADSEGQPGPLTYGRTHADGANLLAAAVKPHGGIVMWRAFVHDFNSQTWAHKAYETFTPLDGDFADNTIVQIKNGPIDFQVREPVHPLFGAMPQTRQMMELQITQEYTGQSTHLCYLPPMWKQVYDFANGAQTVAQIIEGVGGVMNFGSDLNWTRHRLAAANTHGYGRLAWDPAQSPEAIAEEWVRMTFGSDPTVVDVLTPMLLRSWETYEDYTSPLGCGFMITADHFQPNPAGNTAWHQSDADGIGFDRTVATGIGYTKLYHEPVASTYESLDTCPDELLLFMHHVPWSHGLDSGKDVMQHIYDTHFDGVERVRRFREQWRSIAPRTDSPSATAVVESFDRHLEHATRWRDTLVAYWFEVARILDPTRSWVQLTASSATLLGGWPGELSVSVGNASSTSTEVSVQLPDWSIEPTSVSVGARDFVDAVLPVQPELTPTIATTRMTADSELPVLGGWLTVTTAPAGARCILALDAGSLSSPVLPGYQRLAPEHAWDPEVGYGWVGGAPEWRDRGTSDPLLRDFVNGTDARVLRLVVPPGRHAAYLLVGDQGADSWPTFVRVGGDVVACSRHLFGNEFQWLEVTLDEGVVDLELSSVPGQHWHLAALVIPDPSAPLPVAVLMDASLPTPVIGAGTCRARVANTTDAAKSVTVRIVGWPSEPVVASVPPHATIDVDVPVTPPTDPAIATVQVEVLVDGTVTDQRMLDVIAVPAAESVALALDAGTESSPLVGGYQRLSPADVWAAGTTYGWVGDVPESRDRESPDVLRGDFVNAADSRTLRLDLPAGAHVAFALVGDIYDSAPTSIAIDGAVVARSEALPGGRFVWLQFELGGGQTDLVLAGTDGEHWHLNALIVREP